MHVFWRSALNEAPAMIWRSRDWWRQKLIPNTAATDASVIITTGALELEWALRDIPFEVNTSVLHLYAAGHWPLPISGRQYNFRRDTFVANDNSSESCRYEWLAVDHPSELIMNTLLLNRELIRATYHLFSPADLLGSNSNVSSSNNSFFLFYFL